MGLRNRPAAAIEMEILVNRNPGMELVPWHEPNPYFTVHALVVIFDQLKRSNIISK